MKGKHAVSAEARHAIAERDNDLGTYQHRVARLTAENRELREKMAAQERTHRATERRLRAERDEGIAPQLQAAAAAHRAVLEQRDEAGRHATAMRDVYVKVASRYEAHLVEDHGFTIADARDRVMRVVGGRPEDDPIVVVHDESHDALLERVGRDPERYRAIRSKSAEDLQAWRTKDVSGNRAR